MDAGDLEDLRYFLAVSRAGTFSAAARTLGVDQSTVSRRVGAFEATLGKRLFERGPRAVTLTPLGEDLVPSATAAEAALLAFADAAAARDAGPAGRVRVALTEGMAQHAIVPHVLPDLLRDNPGLAVDLVTGEDAVDLARHEADVALRFFRTPRGDLVGQRVARLSVAIVAARSQRRALARLAPRDLPWIGYDNPRFASPATAWLEALDAPPPRITCTSVETQIAAVRAGLGVALTTRAMLRAHDDLVALDEVPLPPLAPLELHVVTRAAIRRVPRVAAVFEALVAALRALDG